MGLTLTSIIIAVLAGIGTYYSWDRNKGMAMGLAVVTAIAGLVGTVGAFAWALGLVFKLLPIALLVFGIWLIWRLATGNSSTKDNV